MSILEPGSGIGHVGHRYVKMLCTSHAFWRRIELMLTAMTDPMTMTVILFDRAM